MSLLSKIRNFKLLACFCDCTGRFVLDLFVNVHLSDGLEMSTPIELVHENTNNLGSDQV